MHDFDEKYLTFDQFSRANRCRCEANDGFNHLLSDWSPAEWLAAATGELGEVAHVVKSILRQRDKLVSATENSESLYEKLGEEIADTIIYLDILAQSVGVDIGESIKKKFNKKSEEIGSHEKL